MVKILMVCMGNICRSPIAEGIMRDLIKKNNLKAIVDSAGTIDFHKGQNPDIRATTKAFEHGLNISDLIARPFVVNDFDKFDWIFVMDNENYDDIVALTKSEDKREKVMMIMNELHKGKNMEVPDPYYGGEQGFENVFQMLNDACQAIAKKIEKK